MCAAVGGHQAAPSITGPAGDSYDAITPANPLTSFVGRTTQLAEVTTLLLDPGVRLLTLAGPGGVGKTRLAEAAADAVAESYPDGVVSISFAAVRERDRIPFLIAEAFGVLAVSGESFESRVITHARDRKMLLVLDNLEQLLPLPFLTRLLTSCPHLTILTTSREVLRVSGEFEYVVPPMAVPGSHVPADVPLESIESVALLIDRARQVSPGFCLTPENADDIAAICARLDGLPLAIELAAARMKVFSPAALRARLDDRLALLTGGPSDRPEHQRTIRDTIGWSHDLLTDAEQRVFRHLGVFAGGITADAVAHICNDAFGGHCTDLEALEMLSSLVDKSLVQRSRQEATEPRFYLLETIRHYALQQLEDEGLLESTSLRHAHHYLEMAERALPNLLGPDQHEWGQRLDLEQANMRAALGTFRDAWKYEPYTRLACALWRFWRMRGHLTEGRRWLDIALQPAWQSCLSPELQAKSRFMAGWLALEQGDIPLATQLGEGALEIARTYEDANGIGSSLRLLSLVDSRLDDNERAMRRMEESLTWHRQASDADNIAGALNNLAILALDTGDYEKVIVYCAESRDAFLRLGNLYGASHSIDTMGVALYCLRRFEESMRCAREALAIDRQLDDTRGNAVSLDHVGKCARALGDLPAAWEAHAESLKLRRDVGDPRGYIVWLEAMALWMVHAGCPEEAAMALGSIEVARTAMTIPIHRHEVDDHEEAEALARRALGDAQFESVVAKGRWLTLEEMLARMEAAAIKRTGELAQGAGRDHQRIADRYGLTAREAEVLHLLAQRYADKEIAEELHISPRTVARHVTGIFTKLNVHSRREVAAMLDDADNG